MIDARSFLLQEMLPTTSDKERELWLRSSETGQRFLEIMKEYAKDVVDECEDKVMAYEDIMEEIENELDGIYISLSRRSNIETIVKKNIEYIETRIRNIVYQI